MGTSASELTSINLIRSWLETKPYFVHCEVELYSKNRDDDSGWILIHNRNVCVVSPEFVEVLNEHCNPEMQYRAYWAKVDICDPEFFPKLEKLLMFWV